MGPRWTDLAKCGGLSIASLPSQPRAFDGRPVDPIVSQMPKPDADRTDKPPQGAARLVEGVAEHPACHRDDGAADFETVFMLFYWNSLQHRSETGWIGVWRRLWMSMRHIGSMRLCVKSKYLLNK
jgi:hypothetical protein